MSSPRADLVFAWEPIQSGLASGLEDLIALHWEEVNQGRGLPPLDIDWPYYLSAERTGAYRGISARNDGALVGYAGYTLQKSMHHRGSLWAFNDGLYLDPDFRGRTALRFLDAAEGLLKGQGVQFVTQGDLQQRHSTYGKARASLGDLLLRRGYGHLGSAYFKGL